MSMSAREPSLPCRWIVDHAAGGAWQMAVDEVLLQSAAQDGLASLRFYEWSEPTLSLGYFQSYAQRASHRASRDCPLVRRTTGGGAILHDLELTYCMALPAPGRSAESAARFYHVAHAALVDVLAGLGVEASLFGGERERPLDEPCEPFLCFERRAAGDVVLDGAKICGSAQRRRQNAILQHGSLLLARSAYAPELPGLAELTGRPWKTADFVDRWGRELASRLRLELVEQGLSSAEWDQVRTLAIEKYDAAVWNRRR